MNERSSKPGNQITHTCAQGPSDFHKRIHRGRFLSSFNPADENGRKVGPFRQLFLAEAGCLASDTNRLAQETTMLLAMHDQLRKQGANIAAMSLTTDFFLAPISLV
jgi:hypothetical protein